MKVIVVGCTHAGTAAVDQILQEHPETEITVYERDDNISFLSCGIALYLGRKVKRLEDMFYSSPADLEKMGAKVKMKHDVLKIDAKNKTVMCEDMKTHEIINDSYDKLIMTTGSYVAVPPIMGISDTRILMCKSYAQAEEIYETAKEYKHITIVGGGYIGVELAESYANTDHKVTLIQSRDQVLNNYLDLDMSKNVIELLNKHDVDVYLNERVTGFNRDDDDNVVIETNEADHKSDLVIVCTGFVPNTELLRGQVEMDRHGAIIINEYTQTSDPDIYAAGDACTVNFNPTGKSAYMPLATNAIRQGALTGTNIFGDIQKYMGTQATSAMELFGYTIASTGLTYKHALDNGINADTVEYHDYYRPDYMPTTEMLTIKLVYNKDNHLILGAQLFSKHEVAQSANTISVCIQNKNTIDDLAFMDMLFQPNYDNPFNYLNLVAQQAVAKERQEKKSETK
ncbi:NADH oxidase [Companilactobacillus crustorum]|uniref:NADH oxidase n=3 Tax=Companilactobacillus TaxID=2767879 RepID=A0A837RIP3_9LACO|nr:FAD-dependent oxidoreductase [Companilactobacillus crustorum]KRK42526.1 NADH oxidase [Companilactobacillus crustorum JCM 15951]KRO20348.1 NADH oxidase [Companilactobacillus crustorum]GEO77343.1 NADH oxidase [Companilactobacillus crustorum]